MAEGLLSDLLDEYGRARYRYAGKGHLANGSRSVSVEWVASQYDDGQVLLACQGDASAISIIFTRPTKFTGHSADGTQFTSGTYLGAVPILADLPKSQAGGWAVYRLSMLHADLPASGPPAVIRHLLTNFQFDAGVTHEPMEVQLPGVEGDIRLIPLLGDPFAIDRLRALRVAIPTAWLETQAQGGQAVPSREIANSVCSLLSIARGTKVAWIQEELVNAEGLVTHRIHSNRVTKPYTPFAPIHPNEIGGTDEFLATTYSAFLDRRAAYRLDRGTIDLILDAKLETDFLETRGAKLAIALEALKHNVLVSVDPDVRYHVEPARFADFLPDIAESVRAVLRRKGIDRDAAAGLAGPNRFLALNRRSFAHLLRRIARQIDLELSNSDLRLFVRCRNSLVHQGDFYCATASASECEEVPPRATKFEEYLFLISIVDAFLLRLVDYRGKYLVRTGGSDWEERTL